MSEQYNRRKFLGTLATLYISGCGPKTPEPPQQTVSTTTLSKLDRRGVESGYNELEQTLYNKAYPKLVLFRKKIGDSLKQFAKNNGISLEQIACEDYDGILRGFELEMKKDPDVKKVLDISDYPLLSKQHKQKIKGIEPVAKVDTQEVILYVKRGYVPAFVNTDMNLQFTPRGYMSDIEKSYVPSGNWWYEGDTPRMENPLIYRKEDCRDVVWVGGAFTPIEYFDTKPTPFARRILTKKLNDYRKQLSGANVFLRKVQESKTMDEDLDSLLRKQSADIWVAVDYTLRWVDGRLSENPLTYQDILKGEKNLRNYMNKLTAELK